jgi:hypothetical protein
MNYAISAVSTSKARTLADRVRDVGSNLGCDTIWVRASGPHVLVGLGAEEAFARVTPLGSGAFGLSFRTPDAVATPARVGLPCALTCKWEPLLLVDTLAEVVEHALVGAGALSTKS